MLFFASMLFFVPFFETCNSTPAGGFPPGVHNGISSASAMASSTTKQSASSTSANAMTSASAPALPINCTDVSNSTSPSCWEQLKMFEWILNWNKTTTACEIDEIWSNCFLRLAYQKEGLDCSTLGSLDCPAPQVGQRPHTAQVFYGAYNIYGKVQQHPP